jgi:cellulose synthase/poly-beta-1,6-N-acetylglucosamine synthase-like glycosyltransferase
MDGFGYKLTLFSFFFFFFFFSFFFFKELYRKSIELACGYMPDNYFGIFDNILCGFCSVWHAINQKEEKRE